jgi:hypothetical protein
MRAKQEQHLFGAALQLTAAALIEDLWLPDQARLNALPELSTAPEICLADCLQALFPEKSRESAPTEFRNFRKRVNDLASEMELSLRCVVDQKKRRAPAERSCWFTALKSDGIDSGASVHAGAGASVDTLDFLGLVLAVGATNILPLPMGEGRLLESRLQAAATNATPAQAGTPTSIGPRPHPDPLPMGERTRASIETLNDLLASDSLPAEFFGPLPR